MFHFIRDLNMIYDNKDKVNGRLGKKLSLETPQDLKEFKPNKRAMAKNRSKSDSYNDWHEGLQERSTYPTTSNTEFEPNCDIPEMVSFVVESKHFLEDFKVVLSELVSQGIDCSIDDSAMEKYHFSSIVNGISTDSDSCDSTKETMKRLSAISNDFKLDYDSDCTDSTEETLEKLCSIASELGFGSENNSFNNENPVEKIIYTVHQDPDKELAVGEDKAESIQCNQGAYASFEEDEDFRNVTILRCISEIRGSIPNKKVSNEESDRFDSDGSPKRKRHASQASFQSNASGGSFAFPILNVELTDSPQVVSVGSSRQRQIVRARRKPIWYPRWRVLTCCRAI